MEWALEINYFKWLCKKVMYVTHPTPSLTYWKLLRVLHSIEFVWLISGDDNRAEDGLELRDEFLFENRTPKRLLPRGRAVSCSVLEMLIAFSQRAEFVTDVKAVDWFWEFLDNLGLTKFNDSAFEDPADIEEILDRFIWRTYSRNGEGGLFPINNAQVDQRNVEIWYQFCDYLADQHRMP